MPTDLANRFASTIALNTGTPARGFRSRFAFGFSGVSAACSAASLMAASLS
jgi:hypothetical protein